MDQNLDLFGLATESKFWDINWNPGVNTKSKHLYLLLLLCHHSRVYASLVKNVLQREDYRHLLQSRLSFEIEALFSLSYREHGVNDYLLFEGSIFEILIQQLFMYREDVAFWMEIDAELFDPSVALLMSIRDNGLWDDGASTKRLLELEADPNMTGYMVTPLQIATYCLNFDEVSFLLKYGAYPNSTGCNDGVAWKQGTMMSYLNHLHGASPLRILRKYTYIRDLLEAEGILEKRQKLEELLLQYGAEEICSTPEAALDEVKYGTPGWKEWAMASPLTRAGTISMIDDSYPDSSADTSNDAGA